MTTIRDISDLVRILKEEPEWADILRGVLLSQELLDLPHTFAKFVETHREQMNAIYHRLEALEAGQARLESTTERLEHAVNAMHDEMGYLSGANFQRRAGIISDRIAERDFGLRDTRLIHHIDHPEVNELNTLLGRAAESDTLDFTEEDAFEVSSALAVVRGTGPGGQPEYLLVEASVTAAPEKVANAARRADLLATATGAPVRPLVIAKTALQEARDAAVDHSVPILLFQNGRVSPPQ